MKTQLVNLILLISVFFTQQAFGGLISTSVNNNGIIHNTVTDTSTNLEWLGWNVTANLSVNDVTALTQEHATLDGWRYATVFEVESMVNDFFGLTIPADNEVSHQTYHQVAFDAKWDAWVNLFQLNDLKDRVVYNMGAFIGHEGGAGQHVVFFENWVNGVKADEYYTTSSFAKDVSRSTLGHALVKEVTNNVVDIPEPNTLALFSLIVLAFVARARSQQS
ncbi:PEP-CTERM sorting domain-containing protein [Thalassotalea fusca]